MHVYLIGQNLQHIHTHTTYLSVYTYVCTVEVCFQEISSKRDYHPGHQQSDLSQGGEEVEVNPTLTTPNHQHLHVLCVCGCECVSLRTHTVTQQKVNQHNNHCYYT